MTDLGKGDGTGWPGEVDTRELQVDTPAVNKTLVDANLLNDILKALVALQTGLGAGYSDLENLMGIGTAVDSVASSAITFSTDGGIQEISGSGNKTDLGSLGSGAVIFAIFKDSMTLIHNTDKIILPGSVNRLTADGDVGMFKQLTGGVWMCLFYTPVGSIPIAHNHSTGDINSGVLSIIRGGTAANTELAARISLGLAIGSDVQAYDVNTSKLDIAETRSASLNFADRILQRPVVKDYGETINDIGATGGGSQDIDLTLGNVAILMVTDSANTFTFSNWPATGIQGSVILKIFGGGTQAVNWPSVMKGDTPTLTDNQDDFTTDFASDEKLDITAHGFMDGDRVQLTSTTTLPAGLSANTVYFVINKTDNDFELSTTEGGSAVNITDNGTGTHTCHSGVDICIIGTDNSGLTLNFYAAKLDMK